MCEPLTAISVMALLGKLLGSLLLSHVLSTASSCTLPPLSTQEKNKVRGTNPETPGT